MAHPAYGMAPPTPRSAGAGGFIPPPPGASQGGEPNPYPHPSPYNWPNNPFPPQPQQYSSYPHASALGGGPTRSARSGAQPHRPVVPVPQQIQSQPSYPYQFQSQPQPQAYLTQPSTSGQAWNSGQFHPSSLPTPSSFPIAPNDFSRYSPYPDSFQQSYSSQFAQQQLFAEDEPQIPFIPPNLDEKIGLPFGGTANAPQPKKPALKRSNSHSTGNQPPGSHIHVINRRRSNSSGAEMLGHNQDQNQGRLKKVVRSDSRAPEILGDQNYGGQAHSNTVTVRPRSGSGAAEMRKENQHGGNQAIVTRSRSGSSGHEHVGAHPESRGRSKKKAAQADRSGPGQVIPAPIGVAAATSSSAANISPTSPTSPTSLRSPTSVPAYAEQDELYDANNLSGRPKDWRPDYCPTLGTSLYLKITRVRSEGDDPRYSIFYLNLIAIRSKYKAYEDSVKRSVHSLLEYTPQSPPLALDLRYKVKGRNGAIISQRVLGTSTNGDSVDFDQPALQPCASRMRLYHPKLPWYVDIRQSNPSGVTVRDVLVQLSSQMRTPIRMRHYYNDSLSDSARAALAQRYSARTEGRTVEGERGVAQVDFLGEKFVMEGLVRGNKGLWEIKTRRM